MNHFVYTPEPPIFWHELCNQEANLFSCLDWQKLLEKSFTSNTIYGWDSKNETGIAITVFKAGPFRIGYIGFPVGDILGNQRFDIGSFKTYNKKHMPTGVNLLRIPISSFNEKFELNLDCDTLPETTIVDLPNWKLSQIPKLNRDIKKANRSDLLIIDAHLSQSSGKKCYDLYRETIKGYNGNLRYNRKYFDTMVALSRSEPKLLCLMSLKDDEISGFIVVARHKKTAYYLHGATNPALKKYGSSDKLIYEAILWAKENEMKEFNLMTSPANQPSLIRYKEKWGGVTVKQRVYEVQINPIQVKAFKTAIWLYGHYRKYVS